MSCRVVKMTVKWFFLRHITATLMNSAVLRNRWNEKNTVFVASSNLLMTKMAPILGQEATEDCFVPRILSLSMDSAIILRKACASNLGEYCSIVSKEVTENELLPCFITLCKDITWQVRKACAEVIMSISSACCLKIRKSTLTPVCAALLSDSHNPVRMAAFETLGPFITTFAEPSITGLAYNQHGQLVLTNWRGFEFRTTPKNDDDSYTKYYEINSSEFPRLTLTISDIMKHCLSNNVNSCNSSVSLPIVNDDTGVTGNVNSSVSQNSVQIISNLNESNENLNGNNENDHYESDDNANRSTASGHSVAIDELQEYNTFLYWRDPLPVLDDLPDVVLDSETDVVSLSLVNNNCSSNSNENVDNENRSDNNDNVSVNNSKNSDKIINDFTEDESNVPVCGNENDSNNCDEPLAPVIKSESKDTENSINKTIPVENVNQSVLSDDMSTYKSAPSVSVVPVPYTLMYNAGMNSIDRYETNDFNVMRKQSMPKFMAEALSALCRKKTNDKPRQNIVPQELIDHYISLTDPIDGNSHDNRFLVYQIAYSLPAVAQTLGKENWPLLKNVYVRLAADKTWKVRRAVASSIHELAAIIGEDAATQDLVPIFNGIIKDLDEVRIGALKHLALFLKTLRHTERNSFLPKLSDFLIVDCHMNWRFREELAEQLLQMVGLFSTSDSYTYLMPLAILLMTDRVAAVRHIAILFVTVLIRWVSSDVRLLHSILVELAEQFAHSTRWKQRQTFALLCSKLISEQALPEEMFAVNVLPHLLDLSWDQVPNVRLAVARTLSMDVAESSYFCDPQCPHHEVVMQTLKRLQADKDKDVQYSAFSKPYSSSTSSSNNSSHEQST